ncbi:hypothetical protein TanjilG_28886 [Lupinus angustifolius]|uniref:Uncharacterized protein n=1 Tax=Lupinus angustifolius TaxID=3871 RepID=A0A1J7GMT0_LUPAN|nr:hypothetical protein TanjilG_28886 [Lupinus angustifolius]
MAATEVEGGRRDDRKRCQGHKPNQSSRDDFFRWLFTVAQRKVAMITFDVLIVYDFALRGR